jgi:hypothetical protein
MFVDRRYDGRWGQSMHTRKVDFHLPDEEHSLLEKCKPFVVRYHKLNGFQLPAGYSVVESLKDNAALQ